MAAYYVDSSAVVKRYVSEPGSTVVREILRVAALHDIHMSEIGGVEVVAALARKGRERDRPSDQFQRAIAEFEQAFDTRWFIVRTTPLLFSQARQLAVRHFLRGYDAVHLAAALEADRHAAAAGQSRLVLVSADAALNAAADAEGMRVLDPTKAPFPSAA